MDQVKIRVKKLVDTATLPTYAHIDDSGMDLFAIESEEILPGKTALIRTGIAIEIPLGTEAQVRPRSGLALKHAITVLNTPGTVDAGYRGEIGVVLINHGQRSFQVAKGMKIAQMVLAPVLRAEIEESDRLSDTERGMGGYGSTGV
ncbi:MAG: dUTP diphosphatase [Cyanobacteria bacterium P01_F01_bin.150]